MAKLKAIMDGSKFKTALKSLPKDVTKEGVKFSALKGKENGKEVVGLYIGSTMSGDYTTDKGKVESGQFFTGTVKRSAKDPEKRIVLETTASKDPLKILAKACLLEHKLGLVIVVARPNEPEPEPDPEVPTEKNGKKIDPEMEKARDKLSAILPDLLKTKDHPVYGATISGFYDQVKTLLEGTDAAAALRTVTMLTTLVQKAQQNPSPSKEQEKEKSVTVTEKDFTEEAKRVLLDAMRILADKPEDRKKIKLMFDQAALLAKKNPAAAMQALPAIKEYAEKQAAKPNKPSVSEETPPTAKPKQERRTKKDPTVLPEPTVAEPVLKEGSEVNCERILLAKKSWNAIKKEFAVKKPPDEMWQFFAYRNMFVTKTLQGLRSNYPDMIWKSVGSVNLTSDFDITVSCPKFRNDFMAVRDFNAIIKAKFGVQPGTLFDTNLYTQDFAAVKPAPNSAGLLEGVEDVAPEQPTEAMMKITQAGQDVASLMKQRRFMSWEDFDAYRLEVLQEMDKEAATQLEKAKSAGATAQDLKQLEKEMAERRTATNKQYEEADALFQMAQAQFLEKVREMTNQQAPQGQDSDGAQILEQQKKNLEDVDKLEHENPDLHMEVSNEVYVKAMEEVRAVEKEILELRKQLAQEEQEGEGTPETKALIDSKLAVLKTKTGLAVFFAAEAYQSEGPIQHIVTGKQAKDEKSKREALEKITANQLLQSFNENLGDFLKDVKHHAEDEDGPGLCFYRASKYLERVMDAVLLIKEKLGSTSALAFEGKVGALPTVVSEVKKGLIMARADRLQFETTEPPLTDAQIEEEKCAFAVEEMQRIFKTNTMEGVTALFLGLGRELNALLRAAETGDKMRAGKGEEGEYFKGATKKK